MECLTCEQLTAEYERAERNSAEARGKLSELRESGDVDKYTRAKALANEAWLESEVAKIILERHQRTHTKATRQG